MKYLRKFNEWNDTFNNDKDWKSVSDQLGLYKLEIKDLEEMLDDITKIDDIDEQLNRLKKLVNKHPQIKNESPYREIYIPFVKNFSKNIST